MPTTYEKASEEVHELVQEVMQEFHPELPRHGVKVGVIFASNTESAAVKRGGYPCAGKISIVSLKDRCEKNYDAELLIDLTWWTEGTPKHHRALIDHEISHLELVEDEEAGGYKTDDLGRPCLKIRLGDWNVGDGFNAVIERHGDFAIEIASLKRAEAKVAEVKTRLFPIDTPPEKPAPAKKDTQDTFLEPEVYWKHTLIADLDGIGPKWSQMLAMIELKTVGKVLTKLEAIMKNAPAKPAKNYLQKAFASHVGLLPDDAKTIIDVVCEYEARHLKVEAA